MLTKGLRVNKLRHNRFRVMGWNVDIEKGCANNHNTTYIPSVSPSVHSEQADLQSSAGQEGTTTSEINLNPKQSVTEIKGQDMGTMSKDDPNSTLCENTTSTCMESIYKDDSKYRLNSKL
jgi:hypothetical protein